jgi:hypothetical protein
MIPMPSPHCLEDGRGAISRRRSRKREYTNNIEVTYQNLEIWESLKVKGGKAFLRWSGLFEGSLQAPYQHNNPSVEVCCDFV